MSAAFETAVHGQVPFAQECSWLERLSILFTGPMLEPFEKGFQAIAIDLAAGADHSVERRFDAELAQGCAPLLKVAYLKAALPQHID